jgi:hypothetical protein
VREQILREIHDLGDAGLVIGAEQGRPVGDREVITDRCPEGRKGDRREDGAAAEGNVAARVRGETPCPGASGEVSMCAMKPSFGVFCASGDAGSRFDGIRA